MPKRYQRKRSSTACKAYAFIGAILCLSTIISGCMFNPGPHQVVVTNEVAERALNTALGKVGAKYTWGGQGPDEFDCSGLIIWTYAKAYSDLKLRIGSTITHDATQDDLWRFNVLPLSPSEIRPGDLVFITNENDRMTHGGLFIGWVDENKSEFRFINASSYWNKVVVDTWPVHGPKRGQWFAGAGRLKTAI